MAKYQHAILNTSRWETETLMEWLCYYRSIGFDHAYIYCNDDDPAELYSRLLPFIGGRDPFVTFHHSGFQGQQDHMYMHFLRNHKDECEWFMFVDADEFLAIKSHPGIKEFMQERDKHFDCIYFNWIWFGPQHFQVRPQGSTLSSFVLREDHLAHVNYFTKTMTRSALVDPDLLNWPPEPMLNHNWPATISTRLRRANVLGDPMDDYFSNFPESGAAYLADVEKRKLIMETAITYHYLFRSRNDFVRRLERGTLGAYYFQPTWKELHDGPNLEVYLQNLNCVEDRFLADYWHNLNTVAAQETTLLQPCALANIAKNSLPTQSSTCQWSRYQKPEDDARGAISGLHTGTDGFHTDLEDQPWWQTDLLSVFEIREIRVFNSLKNGPMAARAFPLKIELSLDEETWQTTFDNKSSSPFGGVDGHPLIVKPPVGSQARFCKLSLKTRDFFHLDQIEIYGTPILP